MATTASAPPRTRSRINARCDSLHGVSPIVNSASARDRRSASVSSVRTSSTRTGSSPHSSATWATPIVAWSSTPCTPAGPSRYGATCVTKSSGSGTSATYCARAPRSVVYREVPGRAAVELVPDGDVVADDPRVVARLDHVRVAGPDVQLGAVVVHHVHRTLDQRALVVQLARVRLDEGLDAFGPLPAGLERDPGGLQSAEIHHADLGLVGRAGLIGRVEALLRDTSHLRLPSRVASPPWHPVDGASTVLDELGDAITAASRPP